MRIHVKVRTRAKVRKVEEGEDGAYHVWISEAPENGIANRAVMRALSDHLGVPISSLAIKKGLTASNKILEYYEKTIQKQKR